jgi:cell division protein FtsZ
MAAVAEAAPAPIAEAPIPAQIMAAPPVEAPAAPMAPAPAPIAAQAPAPAAPIAATAPAPAPAAAPAQRPLVDENDWRVSRPPMKAAVRAAEPTARPMAARPAGGDSRSPNLFQRITGAFSAPKPATAAAPVEPPAVRAAPENVVAVAPKPVVRAAPVQTSISLDVTERSKPARDDDDLQIPAFLRRQAN